jgi:hypothetical protein
MSAAPTLDEGVVAAYLRAQVAGLIKELPEMEGIRLSISTHDEPFRVAISGFVKGTTTHRSFTGSTIAAAQAEARAFLSL